MLVLTRRNGEQILINKGQIIIKVLYQHKGVVTFGIQAPSDVDVDRHEIFIKKQEESKGKELNHEIAR